MAKKRRVLFIDDENFPACVGIDKLDVILFHATSYQLAVNLIKQLPAFDVMYFDHDLGSSDPLENGHELIKLIYRDYPEKFPKEVYVQSSNPVGADNIVAFANSVFKFEGKPETAKRVTKNGRGR